MCYAIRCLRPPIEAQSITPARESAFMHIEEFPAINWQTTKSSHDGQKFLHGKPNDFGGLVVPATEAKGSGDTTNRRKKKLHPAIVG